MLGELDKMQITNILSSQVIGRLACSDGKHPYIVPVTYTYDGKYIYGQSNEGTKLNILRKNPHVCFEVDMVTNMANWQSVVVYGTFEELTNKEADEARDILFNRVYPMLTSSTIHPYGHEETTQVSNGTRIKRVMYRIKINRFSGRFEKQ
jgi:hypothetical protein